MALTMDQLKRLLDSQGLRYFLDPRRDAIMLTASGLFGKYQSVILLDGDGRILQFRSVDYRTCPANNPHLFAVLKVLGEVNYRLRGVKFGWDPQDGEITVYSDLWIEDGSVTQEQFARMLQIFFSGIDLSSVRLGQTIDSGNDPGELSPEDIAKQQHSRGSSRPPAPDDDDRHI